MCSLVISSPSQDTEQSGTELQEPIKRPAQSLAFPNPALERKTPWT